MKRIISTILTAIMLAGIIIVPGVTSSAAAKITTGTLVTFGSYPQTSVVDSETLSELRAKEKSLTWTYYDYYYEGKQEDYMKYADMIYSGEKYRAVKFTHCRPHVFLASDEYTVQEENGYKPNKIYWFKFEPIVWRVLDANTGLLMAENIIDSQPFQNVAYSFHNVDGYPAGPPYYGDKSCTQYASDWAYSSLRKWMNGDFYNTAFSNVALTGEQSFITPVDLTTPSSYSSEYDATPTKKDRVFPLTRADVLNEDYGFSSYSGEGADTNRIAYGTDYARCQGLCVHDLTGEDYSGASHWLLRTPGNYGVIGGVDLRGIVGDVGSDEQTFYIYNGVRPALEVNLKSAISEGIIKITNSNNLVINGPSGTRIYGKDKDVNTDVTYAPPKKNYKTNIPVRFSRNWFRPGSDKYVLNTRYDQGLSTFCSDFAMMGYTDAEGKGITKHLKDCGFDTLCAKMDQDQEEVNTFIAAKTVTIDVFTKKHLVFVGTIGSNKHQWYSNFDPLKGDVNSTTKTNLGFLDARNYAYDRLKEVLTPENGFTKENTILLLTGHSRGAAAANLLAKKIIDEGKWADPENIYAYTFATPNVTARSDVNDEKYNCIFNIVNPEDFVTKVMLKKWGYSKYGTTYVLPSKTNTQPFKYSDMLKRMRIIYSGLTDKKEYRPYTLGEAATQTMIDLMWLKVPKVKNLYTSRFYSFLNQKISPYEFFRYCMLPILAETEKGDSDKQAAAILLCISILLDNSSPLNDMFYKTLLAYFLDLDAEMVLAGYVAGSPASVTTFITPLAVQEMVKSEILNFLVAHHAETYCAYMHALTKDEVIKPKNSIIGAVNCPVDVEIIDKETGATVGRIKDNVVDGEILAKENSVVMTVNGDEKAFWLPEDGDYEIRLIGNDEGVMDYTLIRNDSEEGELERVNFFDVPVSKDKGYSAETAGESYEIAEHELIADDGTVIKPDEAMSAENAVTYEVKIKVAGAGTVSGDTTYTSGDYADISATPEPGNGFAGWYDGKTLVSEEMHYRFRVTDNVTYTARFEELDCKHENTVTVNRIEPTASEEGYSGDTVCTVCYTVVNTGHVLPAHDHAWDGGEITKAATCAEEGIKTYTCAVCDETKTEAVPADPANHSDYGTENKNKITATCGSDGYTGDTYCKGCGVRLSTGEKIRATGNHTWNSGEVTTVATCTTTGIKTYSCTECGATKNEPIPADPTNHAEYDTEIKNEKDATETEDGYTGDKVCSACGAVIEKGTVIPKTSKAYIPGDVNGDGQVLANDARLALRASASLEKLEGAAFKAADVDGNGKILANDARQILRFSAQLINEFEKADK